MMKRVLIIAYHYPPEPAAGALRPGYLARYLPQFGWEPTVLTRPLGDSKIPAQTILVDVPFAEAEQRFRTALDTNGAKPRSLLRSALRSVKETLLFPDRKAPWIPGAFAAAKEADKRQPFDAVLSTAMPASVHIVAWLFSRYRNIPWIADYRDPWQDNLYYPRGPLRRWLDPILERRFVRRAARITTISQPIAETLAALHGRKDIDVIPNAFDPADWVEYRDIAPTEFRLSFAGTMYDGKRSPDLLFGALAALRQTKNSAADVCVDFYGAGDEKVHASAERFGVTDLVKHHGMVPRSDAMRAQRDSAALLIFLAMDDAASTEMGSKFLEYIGAGRPIIAFGPKKSVMREFLAKHRLG